MDKAPSPPCAGCRYDRRRFINSYVFADISKYHRLMTTSAPPIKVAKAKETSPSPWEGRKRSVCEFPGRAVGTPIEPPSTLPEGSFLAFDPPRGRVKFTMQWMRL